MKKISFLFVFIFLIMILCNYDIFSTSLSNEYAGIIEIYYFYSPDCGDCTYIKNVLFPSIEKKYNVYLQVDFYDIDSDNNIEKLLYLEKAIGRPVPQFPVIFIGNTFFSGEDDIIKNLDSEVGDYIKKHKKNRIKKYLLEFDNKESRSFIFENLKVLPIILSGLLDGINPCAFSTIIFLISFLSFSNFKKNKILRIGIFYTLGVFLFYLFAGLGFFKILKEIVVIKLVSYIVKYLSIVLVGFLLVFFAIDIIKSIITKSNNFLLSLPLKIRKRIHIYIHENLSKKRLEFYSFVLGCFISFFELGCTGQIYLPTILYMLKDQTLKIKGFFLLLLYNLFFIIPLVLVFIFSYIGTSAKFFEKIFKKNLLLIKILTFLFFLFLLIYFLF